jgi:hypothetical protein
MWCGSGSWPPTCRVGVGEVAGDRLRPGAGMAFQGAHRGVPGPGQQQRQVGAVLGGVGEGRVAQLVQRPPAGGLTEQRLGASVAQPGAAGVGAAVNGGGYASRDGGAVGEE